MKNVNFVLLDCYGKPKKPLEHKDLERLKLLKLDHGDRIILDNKDYRVMYSVFNLNTDTRTVCVSD